MAAPSLQDAIRETCATIRQLPATDAPFQEIVNLGIERGKYDSTIPIRERLTEVLTFLEPFERGEGVENFSQLPGPLGDSLIAEMEDLKRIAGEIPVKCQRQTTNVVPPSFHGAEAGVARRVQAIHSRIYPHLSLLRSQQGPSHPAPPAAAQASEANHKEISETEADNRTLDQGEPTEHALPSQSFMKNTLQLALTAKGFVWIAAVFGTVVLVTSSLRFGFSLAVIVLGVTIFVAFAFVFFLLSRAVRLPTNTTALPLLLLVWTITVLFIGATALLAWSTFFNKPLPIRDRILLMLGSHQNAEKIAEEHSAIARDEAYKAKVEELIGEVRRLHDMVGASSKPEEIKREAELRKEQPARFRPGSLFWPDGSTIRVAFLDGEKIVQQQVLETAAEWTKYGNINFVSSSASQAEVRVSFKTVGEWSMMGTQCLSVPKKEPTTSLGALVSLGDDARRRQVILHVFGHVLGLIHEHQTPTANLDIDWAQAYAYFGRPPMNWTNEMVNRNLRPVKKADVAYVGKAFDPHSVMLYQLPSEIMISGRQVEPGNRLSPGDIELIRKIYPGR